MRLKIGPLRPRLPSPHDWLMISTGAAIVLVCIGVITMIDRAQIPLAPEAPTITIPWLPATVQRWKDPIDEMGKKYNIDPNLIAIIMTLESGGYSKASSSADAHGLMQVTTLTAKDIAAKYLKKPQTTYNLDDPRTSIEFGTAYLAYVRKLFGTPKQGPDWNTTVELIAASYNGGFGAANSLEKGQGLHDAQTVVYSRDAFNMWRERHAASSPTFDRWQERGGSRLINLAKAEK